MLLTKSRIYSYNFIESFSDLRLKLENKLFMGRVRESIRKQNYKFAEFIVSKSIFMKKYRQDLYTAVITSRNPKFIHTMFTRFILISTAKASWKNTFSSMENYELCKKMRHNSDLNFPYKNPIFQYHSAITLP